MSSSVDIFVPQESKGEFYLFLRNTTFKFSSNIYHTRGLNLSEIIETVIILGDKDSGIVIINKKNYNKKVDNMVNKGIQQEKYKETDDLILKKLESFQSLLY